MMKISVILANIFFINIVLIGQTTLPVPENIEYPTLYRLTYMQEKQIFKMVNFVFLNDSTYTNIDNFSSGEYDFCVIKNNQLYKYSGNKNIMPVFPVNHAQDNQNTDRNCFGICKIIGRNNIFTCHNTESITNYHCIWGVISNEIVAEDLPFRSNGITYYLQKIEKIGKGKSEILFESEILNIKTDFQDFYCEPYISKE